MLLCTSAQIGRNPGLQAIWEDEKQRRREKCESSQIKTPDSQGNNNNNNNLKQQQQTTKHILCSSLSKTLNEKQAGGRVESSVSNFRAF